MQRSCPRASAGFSMLAASCAPSAAPAPTSVCSSSMNRMIFPSRGGDLLEHRSSGAPRTRRGTWRPRPARPDPAPARACRQALGDVAECDALGDPFDDGSLAHAGIADQHRIVLGAAGEDLHGAADFLFAPDHRVQLAAAGDIGEIAWCTSRAPGRSPRARRWSPAACRAPTAARARPPSRGDAQLGAGEQRARRRAAAGGHRQQQVLGRDVLVLEPLGLGLTRDPAAP